MGTRVFPDIILSSLSLSMDQTTRVSIQAGSVTNRMDYMKLMTFEDLMSLVFNFDTKTIVYAMRRSVCFIASLTVINLKADELGFCSESKRYLRGHPA